ncbi:MAG: hypothetical protein H6581_01535 [Bacteroidia bacterium]|nr:hypothetical protein [Bacteroidia bacterium]
MKKIIILLLPLLFVSGFYLKAQSATEAKKPPCTDPEYRQFDFWVGDWKVYSNEKLVGTNRVDLILGECVIMENWEGAGGSNGKSFNTYNAKTHLWEQTWVDNGGNTIHFSGKFSDGAMRMRGSDISLHDEQAILYSMDFTPNPDGSVRQLWQASRDSGNTWKVLFDGLYKK